jgi:hypothetical protein
MKLDMSVQAPCMAVASALICKSGGRALASRMPPLAMRIRMHMYCAHGERHEKRLNGIKGAERENPVKVDGADLADKGGGD